MTWMEPPDYVAEYYVARFDEKSFIMLEGATDRALWDEYMDRNFCSLYPTKVGEGKDTIIEALTSSWLRGLPGFAGIVDADYWLISQADELGTDNLLYDNCCPDMELMLLSSPTLKKVLRNNFYKCDVEQIHDFAEKLINEAQCLAAEFGYFRLFNHLEEDRGLKFKDINLFEVIDTNKLKLDRELVASKLTGDKPGLTSEELLQQVDNLREKYPPDNIQLCRGHDVVSIMAIIMPVLFQAEFGDEMPQSMNERDLSRNLRTAYEYGYFRDTSLFDCIQEWESANAPYKILKPDI